MDFSAIYAYINAVANQLVDYIGKIWSVLAIAINSIFTALEAITGAGSTLSNSLFGGISSFFHDLWVNYIKIAIAWLFKEIQRLWDFLHKILDPLLRWLQKIRAWYDTHILPAMMKQLALIQKIRQFLTILRLFHVGWATTLDNKLAEMQGLISDSIAIVRGYLNSIINWIAIITDQTNVIRRSVLGSWLVSNLSALKRIMGYGDNRPLTDAEKAAIAQGANRYTDANTDLYIKTLATTGLTDQDIAEDAAAQQALINITGQPLPF